MTTKSHVPILAVVGLWTIALTAAGQQWVQTTSLPPDGYQEQGLVYASGFLYQTGGVNGFYGELDGTNVFYSQVNSNGTIGVWKNTIPLPEAVYDHTSVAANGFVYVIGGNHYTPANGDFTADVVYYSKINSDGSLGSWQVTSPLPYPAFFLSASVWNNRIYIIGGWVSSNATNGVYSANIQSDGSLSPWIIQALVPNAIYTQGEVANGMLYVLGGAIDQGTRMVNTVNYSRINADGTLAGWNQTTPLPQPLANFAAVVVSGRIYVMGGWAGTSISQAFYESSVEGDGALGAWSACTPLPQPLFYFPAAVNDTHIYFAGGASSSSTSPNVYSMALPAPPAAPMLVSSNFQNGNFQIQLASTTNTGFGLLASTNLTAWTNIGWGFTGTNGSLLFQDTNAASFPQRFYRAYWPLP